MQIITSLFPPPAGGGGCGPTFSAHGGWERSELGQVLLRPRELNTPGTRHSSYSRTPATCTSWYFPPAEQENLPSPPAAPRRTVTATSSVPRTRDSSTSAQTDPGSWLPSHCSHPTAPPSMGPGRWADAQQLAQARAPQRWPQDAPRLLRDTTTATPARESTPLTALTLTRYLPPRPKVTGRTNQTHGWKRGAGRRERLTLNPRRQVFNKRF